MSGAITQYIQIDGENSCRWKHISHTFMYLRLTTFTKKTSPNNCHFTYYIFFYFYFALGLHPVTTLLTAGALTSPAARDSFKRVHDWCKAGWRRSGAPPPPNKNPGYSGGSASRLLSWRFLSHVAVCILNAYSVNTIYTICSIFI